MLLSDGAECEVKAVAGRIQMRPRDSVTGTSETGRVSSRAMLFIQSGELNVQSPFGLCDNCHPITPEQKQHFVCLNG